MKYFFQKKVWVILLATLALGALTVLAVSLDEVSFREAQRYRREPVATLPPITSTKVEQSLESVPIWQYIVMFGLVAVLFILVGLLLSPEQRKRMFRVVFRAAVTAFAFYYFLTHYGDTLLGLQGWGQAGENAAAGANSPPMPVFEPPQVSPMVSYIVSFSCALVWLGVMWALYRGWKRYASLNSKKPLGEIARIARSSLNDLSTGRDSSDVIINCYLRMSDVVADKRKLHRELAMTPQEFAQRLERAGLPGDAVRRLTGLFEVVRYGDRKSAPKDVTEAVSCLNAILHSCGEAL